MCGPPCHCGWRADVAVERPVEDLVDFVEEDKQRVGRKARTQRVNIHLVAVGYENDYRVGGEQRAPIVFRRKSRCRTDKRVSSGFILQWIQGLTLGLALRDMQHALTRGKPFISVFIVAVFIEIWAAVGEMDQFWHPAGSRIR